MLLRQVTAHYLNSRQFNGMQPTRIAGAHTPNVVPSSLVRSLVAAGWLTVEHGHRHPNPFIRALEPEPVDVQLARIDTDGVGILYPSTQHLRNVVTDELYADQPYRRAVALGTAQLHFLHFDPRVLEHYLEDPRYYFVLDDFGGRIGVRDGEHLEDHEHVLLETFGFSYTPAFERAVTTFPRYLSRLPAADQQRWQTYQLNANYIPHGGYYRRTAGHWPQGISIFRAIVEERDEINRLALELGRPALFRTSFAGENRPRTFGWLLRPTLGQLNAFTMILDQMLSDDLNRDFFRGVVELEERIERRNGEFEVRPRGTIALLRDWIASQVADAEIGTGPDRTIEVLRNVRQLRQTPAHSITEDAFNMDTIEQQRQLLRDVHEALNGLRRFMQILADDFETPAHLDGVVWTR